jgi:CheY-like chemotaxis protein
MMEAADDRGAGPPRWSATCAARQRLVYSFLDSTRGKTVRVYECQRCGEHIWYEQARVSRRALTTCRFRTAGRPQMRVPLSAPGLRGLRILVVEDEYMLAEDLRLGLEKLGVEVMGPVATVAQALTLLQSGVSLDGAVLDVNLQGDYVFPVLDLLRKKRIPFVLTTGYDGWALPEAYVDAPRCEKPLDMRRLTKEMCEQFAP